MSDIRVLVCGGRDFHDEAAVKAALDNLHSRRPISQIIEGGARGADTEAALWAATKGISVGEFPADWDTWGRAAGARRNQQMLDQDPDLVVAFPGGPGTADMVRRAKAAGVEVWEPMK